MPVTRFPSRTTGVAERVSGFIAHLRMNGLKAGPKETEDTLAALTHVDAHDPGEARIALKTVLAADHDAWRKFDELFDAYWFNAGRKRHATAPREHVRSQYSRPTLWQPHFDAPEPDGAGAEGEATHADTGEDAAEGTDGRLIATRTEALTRRDLRELMDEDSIRAAERAARILARALRDRRSRRRRAATNGRELDMRRILRASLARGGEPIDLKRRKRPDRPMRIVAICDVSGSMTVYARVFLALIKGLLDADTTADAYLFHTRLMRITSALRDHDTLRAAGRLSLMAKGFGGGTNIAGSLASFCDSYAAKAVNGRTVVIILSDGYCTAPPGELSAALVRLKRRARRIVWLNPLKGWKDYAPVAASMSAALPHLDAHLPANTIEALAALETEFARL
jgi:uncharacterized protein with von Willebrand factor type A (vWA) domain